MAILNNKQFAAVAVVGLVGAFIVARGLRKTVAAVNPLDENNVINQAANSAVNTLKPAIVPISSNREDAGKPLTIGDRIFVFFNPDKAKDIGLTR